MTRYRWLLVVVLLATVGYIALGSTRLWQNWASDDTETRFVTVSKQTLEVSLIERGKLESQANVKVVSEVEDIRGDGIMGNALLELVDNGAFVKKGDLLASLDSGTHVERFDEQILRTDKARARQLEADVRYKNQISKNETLAAAADLNLRLAKLELEMFQDPQKGTHRLQVDEINRTIDETENEILAAKASLQLSQNDLEGLETLYRYGYVGKNELERIRLDYLQAQGEVAAKTNRLQTQIASVEKMNVFERKMQLMQLDGAVKTATRTKGQVKLNNGAALASAQAELDRANRYLEKEEELLERYQWHLDRCKIYAPQDGMVAYASPRHYRQTKVELGATMWEGQTILYLPDLKHMQVETAVHETARAWVSEGLAATIRLEADEKIQYAGSVQRIDLMPDRRKWEETDTKVYKTLVTIDEEIEGSLLKPGMTAVVEIHLDAIKDAVVVPLEAIIYEQDSTYCHVERAGRIERVEVKLGRSNENVVQVKDGLVVGESVALPQ